jgi:uncharacterized protein
MLGCLLTGLLAGGLAGLLGVGGGIVIVPALVALFIARGVDAGLSMHLALGTSLASIVFTSLMSIRAHHARGAVRWDVACWLAPGLAVGSALAGFSAHAIPGAWLKGGFGVFAIVIGVGLLRGARAAERSVAPLSKPALALNGLAIGAVSGLAGTGGGSLTVPLLNRYGVKMIEAIATAAVGGLPIALGGALGYLIGGWHAPGLPNTALGHIDLLALALIAPASMLAAPRGAALAHSLNTAQLKRVFGGFLLVVGVAMVVAAAGR